MNKIFTAFNLSDAAIHVFTKWCGLCGHFLVGDRNGTREMLQPLPGTRKIFASFPLGSAATGLLVATSPVLTLSEIPTRIHRLRFHMSFEFLIRGSMFFANLFCLHFDTGWLTLSYLNSVFCHDHLLHYFLLLHKYESNKITPKIMLNAKGEIALRLFYKTHLDIIKQKFRVTTFIISNQPFSGQCLNITGTRIWADVLFDSNWLKYILKCSLLPCYTNLSLLCLYWGFVCSEAFCSSAAQQC